MQVPESVLKAFHEGRMTPEDGAAFRADVEAGRVSVPEWFKIEPAQDPQQGFEQAEQMNAPDISAPQLQAPTDQQAAMFSGGGVGLPLGTAIPQQPEAPKSLSLMESIDEMFTGRRRRVPETEALPDWTTIDMPGVWSDIKTAVATMSTGPKETADILVANLGQNQETGEVARMEQDAKGNYVIYNPHDGKKYAIKPGFRASDVPRVAGTIATDVAVTKGAGAAGLLGRGASTLKRAAALEAGLQAGREGVEAASGGSFDIEQIPMAAAGGVGGELVERGARLAKGIVTPTEDLGLVDRIRKSMTAGDEEALSKAAMETPEAFQTAQKQGPLPEAPDEEVAKVIKDAALGNKKAQRKVAEMAEINPEAKEAFEQLDMYVPPDVLSDNEMVRSSAGLGRSLAGTEPEAAWLKTVKDTVEKSDKIMEDIGAVYTGGGPSTASVSDKVFGNLKGQQNALKAEYKPLYDEVEQAVKPSTKASFDNTEGFITGVYSDVREDLLSGDEKLLLKLVDSETPVSFRELKRLKTKIRNAKKGLENPFPSLEYKEVKQLEDMIKADELATVDSLGIPELSEKLNAANLLYAQKKTIDDEMVSLFGKDLKGSISSKLSGMIAKAGKPKGADPSSFNRMMDLIPEDIQGEAILTGLADATRATSGVGKGDFGLSQFNDIWKGLKRDEGTMMRIKDALDRTNPGAFKTLNALQIVGDRMTSARARVLQTGKANQALKSTLEADGLISTVLEKGAGVASLPVVGKLAGGDMTGRIMRGASEMASKGGKKAQVAMGELFEDPKFLKTLDDIVEKKISQEKASGVLAYNGKFRKLARELKLPTEPTELRRWVVSALRSNQTMTDEDK